MGIVVLSLLLIPLSAQAGENAPLAGSFLRMGWALLVVVGLILILYAMTVMARKRPFGRQAGGQSITILETRAVSPRASLILVEARGRTLLLGLGSGEIRLLADLSDSAPADTPTPTNADDGKPPSADFATLLAKSR
ncbi:MAG: FliO/MopB family protein [Desulfobulbus sp.]|jgi:flagellar protein FliO/FliZ